MSFTITNKTTFSFDDINSCAKQHVVKILERDFEKVFSAPIKQVDDGDVCFIASEQISEAERFEIVATANKVTVTYKDDLAFIYAVLYISRNYLCVDDFWFWAEREPKKANRIDVQEGEYVSPKAKVKYRGWFVNDEVCLIGWSSEYPPVRAVWECVFETLLRLGGNMVIPGTDLPREGEHFEIATEMGLYITHHHAEPLGGEMFLRAYPDKEASYDVNADLFEKLWAEAIEKNKDKKIIWTVGFRGQGDAPFWHNDPKYTTPQSRADVIRKVIDKQYKMICEKVQNPVCAVYLYGEITELYEGGYLKLPDDFIKIWADNGYGKMVVRRSGNHNPRTPALPHGPGEHGLYYHITFHDLQASNHLTLLPNPIELVDSELDDAFDAGGDTFVLLNCGNIRPHVYTLALVAEKWNKGKVTLSEFRERFSNRFFDGAKTEAVQCYDKYADCCIRYGSNEDDRAGEEFYYHTARRLITSWVKRKNQCAGLVWATGDIDIHQQLAWIKDRCKDGIDSFSTLLGKCEDVYVKLKEKKFFNDNLMFQVKLHLSGAKGLLELCNAYEAFLDEKYPESFVILSDCKTIFYDGALLMDADDNGMWQGFYSADWLTNVRATIEEVIAIRKFVRLLGDAPDYFKWFKYYVMPETERNIYLENTQRRTLGDDDLAEKLKIALDM